MKRKLLDYEKQAESYIAVDSFITDRKLISHQNRFEADINVYVKQNKNEVIYKTKIFIDYYDRFTYDNCSKYTIKFDNISSENLKYDYIDTNYDLIKYDETSKKTEDRYLKFKIGSKNYRLN